MVVFYAQNINIPFISISPFDIIVSKKGGKNMEPNEQLIQMASNVAEIALKNTACAITGKIRAIKEKRDDKATIAQLEEIINELLTDKNDLIRIIGTYEEEFVAQKLTDSDMEYIIKNVLPALTEIAESMEQEQAKKYLESIKALSSLFTPGVLKIMQLLGFNFKQGIGQPLTMKLKNTIESINRDNEEPELRRLAYEREIQFYKLLQDEEAYKRFLSFQQ